MSYNYNELMRIKRNERVMKEYKETNLETQRNIYQAKMTQIEKVVHLLCKNNGHITITNLTDRLINDIPIDIVDLILFDPNRCKELVNYRITIKKPLQSFVINQCNIQKKYSFSSGYHKLRSNLLNQYKKNCCKQMTSSSNLENLINKTNQGQIKWQQIRSDKTPGFSLEIWRSNGDVKYTLQISRKTIEKPIKVIYTISPNINPPTSNCTAIYNKLYQAIQVQTNIDKQIEQEKRRQRDIEARAEVEELRQWAKKREDEKRQEQEEFKNILCPTKTDYHVSLNAKNSIIAVSSTNESIWHNEMILESKQYESSYVLAPILGTVDIIKNDGSIIIEKLLVYYHLQKQIYYAMNSEICRLQQMGTISCKIVYYTNDPYIYKAANHYWYNSETLLHRLGYTVGMNGVSKDKRHGILRYVLDNHLCTWSWISNHIRTDILRFRTRPEYRVAVIEWEKDLEFLKDLAPQSARKDTRVNKIYVPDTMVY